MKKLFALFAVLFLCIAVNAQVTNAVTSFNAGDVGGKYVVNAKFNLDSMGAQGVRTPLFSLVEYDGTDFNNTKPMTFKWHTNAATYGDSATYFQAFLCGTYATTADTVVLDTITNHVSLKLNALADSSGILTLNAKSAVNYYIFLKPLGAAGHDITNGTISIVATRKRY